jgi:hypothetical protein
MLMSMIIAVVAVASIAWAIVATLVRTATDGYGRIPNRVAEGGRPSYRRIW